MSSISHHFAQLLISLTLAGVTLPTLAAEVAGIKFAETVQIGNRTLVLNGAGIRTFFVAKVYAMALYAPSKSEKADDLLANKPRKIIITALREVDSNELAGALLKGMRQNLSKDDSSAIAAQMGTFGQLFSSVPFISKGETIAIEYTQEYGTHIFLNDKKLGTPLKGEKFFHALLSIWLGDKPVEAALKRDLLGQPAPAPQRRDNF